MDPSQGMKGNAAGETYGGVAGYGQAVPPGANPNVLGKGGYSPSGYQNGKVPLAAINTAPTVVGAVARLDEVIKNLSNVARRQEAVCTVVYGPQPQEATSSADMPNSEALIQRLFDRIGDLETLVVRLSTNQARIETVIG